MAWIEYHPARIKRLQKFSDFRRDLQLSVNEALGLLGSFWGEVIELAETGDISGWTPAYACEVAGSGLNPERVWAALVKHRWVDERTDGKKLIHDWLDCAGRYLIGKYAKDNRAKLLMIWALHGRIYGAKFTPNQDPTDSQQNPNRLPPPSTGRGKGMGKGLVKGKGDARGKPNVREQAEIDMAKENPIWDELVAVFNLKPTTRGEQKELGKIVASYKEKGCAVADIKVRAGRYRLKWGPDIDCNPRALLKHWDKFESEVSIAKTHRSEKRDREHSENLAL